MNDLFGDKCLHDILSPSNSGELNSKTADNKPNFNVGDKVIALCGDYQNLKGTIRWYSEADDTWAVMLDGLSYPVNFAEEWIAPCTDKSADNQQKGTTENDMAGLRVTQKCDSARIAVPTVYGHLEHEPTKYHISVYSKIGWFQHLMLRWCFGLRYVKHNK